MDQNSDILSYGVQVKLHNSPDKCFILVMGRVKNPQITQIARTAAKWFAIPVPKGGNDFCREAATDNSPGL